MAIVKKRFAAFACAVLLAMLGAFAVCSTNAWAADDPSYDPNAEVLIVGWTDGDGYHETTVTEEMVQGKISTNRQGVLFSKNDIWHVVGTDRWVSLRDVLVAAGAYDSVTVDTYLELWVYDDETPGTLKKYTKYEPYYDEMSEKGYPLYFFDGTSRTSLAKIPEAPLVETCIALNCASAEIAAGSNAGTTLSALQMDVKRAPRLLWGLHWDDTETGGNRFPSNIGKIVLTN